MWLWLLFVAGSAAQCPDVGTGVYKAEFHDGHWMSVLKESGRNFLDVVLVSKEESRRYSVEYIVSSDCLLKPLNRAMWRKILFDVWFISERKLALGMKIEYDRNRLRIGDQLELIRVR